MAQVRIERHFADFCAELLAIRHQEVEGWPGADDLAAIRVRKRQKVQQFAGSHAHDHAILVDTLATADGLGQLTELRHAVATAVIDGGGECRACSGAGAPGVLIRGEPHWQPQPSRAGRRIAADLAGFGTDARDRCGQCESGGEHTAAIHLHGLCLRHSTSMLDCGMHTGHSAAAAAAGAEPATVVAL